MNRNDFLEKDLPEAVKIHRHCNQCLDYASFAFNTGDYDLAEKWMTDFQQSMDKIKRLHEKKLRRDRMDGFLEELKLQGISVDRISRII